MSAASFSGSDAQLPGVILLSEVLTFNQTLASLSYVVDPDGAVKAFLVVALPFVFMWLVGIGFVSYHTDDDGYLMGARSVGGNHELFRIFNQMMCYLMEMGQIIALTFGKGATSELMSGDKFYRPAVRYLWSVNYYTTFPVCAAFQVFMIILMIIPAILWLTIKRDTFAKVAAVYRAGWIGAAYSFLQDCFMLWFVIPIMMQLLRGIPCTYYLTGEEATALAQSTECGSGKHKSYAIAGGIIAILAYITAIMAGTIPELVKRSTDVALNGRYISVSYAIKCMMVVVYIVAADASPFYHLSFHLFLQVLLLFASISLRPSLLERINYHRSAAFAITLIPTVMCIVGRALDDPLTVLPLALGVSFLCAAVVLIVLKYYAMVCGKLLPEIDFEGGRYKGDLCLGMNLPHGYGTLSFPTKKFTGRFVFGKYDGYGAEISVSPDAVPETTLKQKLKETRSNDAEEMRLELAKEFFNGMHKGGRRCGFGTTNVMPHPDELSYEGFWLDDQYQGEGTKKFRSGDEYVGLFHEMLEHGEGTWSFDSSLGPHKVSGAWDKGTFTSVRLNDDEIYEGELRYGVPHGEGKLTIGDIVFEGEWRAGKMHGLGTADSPEGHYDGNFFEGKYHDNGTWTDDVSTYSGKFKNGLKHGLGREETEDGLYEGMFEEGERSGYGTFRYSSGAIYQGSWRNGEYNGAGFLRTAEFEFDGLWLNGKRHGGRGHVKYENGEEYLGGWAVDCFQGNGVLRLPGLGEFHGVFEAGNKVGLGRFNFRDGSEYVGMWDDDLASGEGKLVFNSRKSLYLMESMDPDDPRVMNTNTRERYFLDFGGTYVGEFAAGQFGGKGTVTTTDGTMYDGEWKDGLPHGRGQYSYPGGGHYVGGWAKGQREGRGIMEYVDNRSYEGEWLAGRRHGQGLLCAPNGDVLHDGDWLADVPVTTSRVALDRVVIPTVDVDEFIRAIMPAASSITEIEESRGRKRMELEELQDRLFISLELDERLARIRLMKQFFSTLDELFRADLEAEEWKLSQAMQKSTLGKVLNVFKAQFKYENDRDPKKSDLLNNRTIGPIYRRYQELANKV